MDAKGMVDLVKETFSEWREDNASRLAAALAYYSIFSLGPLLLIAIAIAGLVFGEEAARGQVVGQIEGMVGRAGAEQVETVIANANRTGGSIVSLIVGLVTLFFGAMGVFGELKNSLNRIWEIEPKSSGILAMIKERFLSMTMVLGTGFLLLVSLVISAALTALGTFMSGLIPGAELLWQVVNFIISLAVITLLFALIFKILPDAEITWRDVWLGAFVTALLFTIGKFALGFYLGRAGISDTFGAAGSLVVILVWVYYSAQILFFGAEFTQVYAQRYGSRIVPEAGAGTLPDADNDQPDRRPQADGASTPAPAATAAGHDERGGTPRRGAQPDAMPERRRPVGDRPAAGTGASPIMRGLAMLAAGTLVLLRLRSPHHGQREAEPRRERTS